MAGAVVAVADAGAAVAGGLVATLAGVAEAAAACVTFVGAVVAADVAVAAAVGDATDTGVGDVATRIRVGVGVTVGAAPQLETIKALLARRYRRKRRRFKRAPL